MPTHEGADAGGNTSFVRASALKARIAHGKAISHTGPETGIVRAWAARRRSPWRSLGNCCVARSDRQSTFARCAGTDRDRSRQQLLIHYVGGSKRADVMAVMRAGVLAGGRKARLADTLIAQTCLDHEVPLITRNPDFQAFHSAGLALLLP